MPGSHVHFRRPNVCLLSFHPHDRRGPLPADRVPVQATDDGGLRCPCVMRHCGSDGWPRCAANGVHGAGRRQGGADRHAQSILYRGLAVLAQQAGVLYCRLPAAVLPAPHLHHGLLRTHLPCAAQPSAQKERPQAQPANQPHPDHGGSDVHRLLAAMEPVQPDVRVQPSDRQGQVLSPDGLAPEDLRHGQRLREPIPVRVAE